MKRKHKKRRNTSSTARGTKRPVRNDKNPEDPIFCGRAPGVSDEVFEAFLARVRAFETAPETTLARQLIEEGIELPDPDTFTESTVHEKLWEVIRAMARHHNFLTSTDHLSDLELYRYLWEDTLNVLTPEVDDPTERSAWFIDLVSDGSEESTRTWLRYYAEDFDREGWAEEFPGDSMPERCQPAYDRDRILPRSDLPGLG